MTDQESVTNVSKMTDKESEKKQTNMQKQKSGTIRHNQQQASSYILDWLKLDVSNLSKRTKIKLLNYVTSCYNKTDTADSTLSKTDTADSTLRKNMKYQEYKPKKGFVLVKLKVKNGLGIPKSFRQYYVEIGYEKSPLGKQFTRDTSKILAIRSPVWNETLTFLVKKEDWTMQKNLEIKCSLKSSDYAGNVHFIAIETSMSRLLLQKYVTFNSTATETGIQIHIDVEVQMETDVDLRKKPQLCRRETEFVGTRKEIVMGLMQDKLRLKNMSTVDDVPNIAIIGSGGGIRAVIGMCGAMTALQDDGILDAAMYLAGLSGSSWYLMTLYANNEQLNPKAVNKSIRHSLQNSNVMEFWNAWYSWKYHTVSNRFNHGKYFTITDTFGEMIGSLLLGKKCKQTWSEQTRKLDHGNVPLPILAALHVRDEESIDNYHDWIEMTPYEAYIPKYGTAIDMKNFGDKFYGGFVIKEYEEQPIHFLAGICGSAYAKAKKNKKPGSKWYNVVSKTKEWIQSWFNIFENRLIGTVPNWLKGMRIEKKSIFQGNNETDEHIDTKKEGMMLADAGIAFNSPYPLVLNPARKVDFIISFDFTDRGDDKKWPFEELVKAAKWAEDRRIPFPKLNLPAKKDGKFREMYIFTGDNAPTIVHFVMVNNKMRESKDFEDSDQTDFNILPDYSTCRFTYSNQEFDKFKSLIEYNVSKASEEIIDFIQCEINQKVVHRRIVELSKEKLNLFLGDSLAKQVVTGLATIDKTFFNGQLQSQVLNYFLPKSGFYPLRL